MDQSKLRNLVDEFLAKNAFSLYKLTYSTNNKEGTLSIIVDKDTPISLDDIVDLSEKLSTYLDQINLIEEAYTLDVSSLGAEKPIDVSKLENYLNSYVNLHLSHPFKGENILEGTLEKIENGEVTLSYFVKGKKTLATFPLVNVDAARLAIKF